MVKRVGIVAKIRLESVGAQLVALGRWLDVRGIESVLETHTAELAGVGPERPTASRDQLPTLVDLIVVLGGDGTLLGMAERVALSGRDVPILGVNFGHLGFLTEIALPELYSSLEAAIAGTSAIDERLMLHATVTHDHRTVAAYMALNDVVVTRSALSRIVELSVSVGGEFVARFFADGLIIASPTGSTAYNLSAGGPILHPAVDAIVLTPIAPHTLSNRPIVIPGTAAVSVTAVVHDASHEVFVTVDGQSGGPLHRDDTVQVARHTVPLRLIPSASHSYFTVLREKLKWAER